MARRKNQPELMRRKHHLAERLRTVRIELFGIHGGPELARQLGLPVRTWYNYESGVTVPAQIILLFVELTSANPAWLHHGEGARYRSEVVREEPPRREETVEFLLRKALARLARGDPHQEAERPIGSSAEDRLPHVPDWAGLPADFGSHIRAEGNAMAPIVVEGAIVVFEESTPVLHDLEETLVVAWINGAPMVRWCRRSGHFALLRVENPTFVPCTDLIDLDGPPETCRVHGVRWVSNAKEPSRPQDAIHLGRPGDVSV